MIARLTGKLIECEITEVVVDVGGVGYAVTIPMSTYDKLPRVGETVTLLTHHHVREDAVVLYGFATARERQLFRLLMDKVSGIGPKVAIGILSGVEVDAFCQLVAAGDIKGLSKLNGVGKRTAERLVVELKDKVAEIAPAAVLGVAGAAAGAPVRGVAGRDAQDAVAALTTLGFKADQAQKAVGQLCTDLPAAEQNVQNLIRRALQLLNG